MIRAGIRGRTPVAALDSDPVRVRRRLPVDVIPKARLPHETADLVHALRPSLLAQPGDELDHPGVALRLGMAHLQTQPFDR